MIGAHTDITKIIEKLQTQNTVLQSTIESYKDVLLFSIDKEYKYLILNSAFKLATFHAYGTEVTIGMSMLESISNIDDRKKAKDNCDRALAGEGHVTVEVYGELTRYYYETRYSPIVNEKSEIIGVTVLSTNVTERKRAEEQLHELNKELESFSYSVSHDLRTPLRSINGYASILKEDFAGNLEAEAKKMIDTIYRNAEKMGNLIDDLLAFSRLGRKDIIKSEVNMNVLVRNVINELHDPDSNKKTIFEVHSLSSVSGDNTLLKQVWVNLISNALKYSGNKTMSKIEIGCNENENGITYYVKDNGVGFDMKYYNKLFGVFQRLHSEDAFEGTGVGLAIVHRIVSRLGGKVWAEAKINEGSNFFFTLPK